MEVVFVEEKPIQGAERRVGPGTIVGRAEADVALPDPDVSRRHAVFHQVDAGIGVEDLGSRNGTFLNREPVHGPRPLAEGDRLDLAGLPFRCLSRLPDEAAAAGAEEAFSVAGS
jgi:pSer/pThr/pTyr-binding forkhead associated (FHA) protein